MLLTGVFGAGKSTVAAEIAGMLEERGLPYGALDLDWLGWFDNGKLDHHGAGQDVMFANLSAVVGNYRQAGVRLRGSSGRRVPLPPAPAALPCRVRPRPRAVSVPGRRVHARDPSSAGRQ